MADLKNLKVLYVEDDKSTRDALSYYLKKRTGKLITAATGKEAILQHDIHKPDIMVVDILLPDMNGMDVIEEIRKEDKDCRVVITSSVDEKDVILKAFDYMIDGYIIKPINPKLLVDKLEYTAGIFDGSSAAKECVEFEEKGVKEAAMKKDFLDILKKKSGRGARDVMVTWLADSVEIIAYDPYTAIEKTLLRDIHNTSMIEQFRELFYKGIQNDIKDMIQQNINARAGDVKIIIDVKKQADKINVELV